tara:strand:- start:590 stop:805 length:216 start_codon:yes stop_codon:yes gene_type:complete
MAKYDLKFLDLSDDSVTISTYCTDQNEICIRLIDEDDSIVGYSIFLDKSTAIKFAKTLRTEINKIQEVGNV